MGFGRPTRDVLTGRCFLMEDRRDDRRTRYSKMVIRDALFELMREKDMNKISVKELCERADVNRSTFYSYYADITDLHKKIIKEFFTIQRQFINRCMEILDTKPDLTNLNVDDFYKVTLLYLTYVKENREMFRFIFLTQTNSPIQISFDKVFYSEITRRLPPAQKEIFRRSFTFTSGGTSALFVRWILEDFATPVESLAKSLAYYYNGVFNGHKFARKK